MSGGYQREVRAQYLDPSDFGSRITFTGRHGTGVSGVLSGIEHKVDSDGEGGWDHTYLGLTLDGAVNVSVYPYTYVSFVEVEDEG